MLTLDRVDRMERETIKPRVHPLDHDGQIAQ